MDIQLDTSGLNELTKKTLALPGLFERAKISAMRSTGFYVKKALQEQVETGDGWANLHPLTTKFYHKRGVKASWQRRNKKSSALSWLKKFARYRVLDDGSESIAGFGKSRKGETGTIDKFLMSVVDRAEQGERIPVTESMRNFFGATRRSNSNRQTPGQTFFPLRKETKQIEIPRRPIFGPVMSKIESNITPYFEDKFWNALNRYKAGAQKT